METSVEPGRFRRPIEGTSWVPGGAGDLPGSGVIGWQSNGGHSRRHPARALPFTLEVMPPVFDGRLISITVVGVFSLYATPDVEPSGALGGSLQLLHGTDIVFRRDLIQGRHYSDSSDPTPVYRLNGDGTTVETVGTVEIEGVHHRVDSITFDVPGGIHIDKLVLRDLGTPASFLVFDVLFELENVVVCPFKGHGGHVALSEIGSILRMRDRSMLDQAMHQLAEGVKACHDDLDEAKGLGLTFLAAIVGAMLEMDAPRSAHKAQLEAARRLDKLETVDQIAFATLEMARALTDALVKRNSQTGDALIDRAIDIVTRNYTRDIDDAFVAGELSLSTSHFRYLFREATKQPFHKYLVSLRLEKAREALLQTQNSVSEVGRSVGFQSSAHFSRAFAKRFGIAPSTLRQARR